MSQAVDPVKQEYVTRALGQVGQSLTDLRQRLAIDQHLLGRVRRAGTPRVLGFGGGHAPYLLSAGAIADQVVGRLKQIGLQPVYDLAGIASREADENLLNQIIDVGDPTDPRDHEPAQRIFMSANDQVDIVGTDPTER